MVIGILKIGFISQNVVNVIISDNNNEQDKVFGKYFTGLMLDCTSLESIVTRVEWNLCYDSSINTASSIINEDDNTNYDHLLLDSEELVLNSSMGRK